jgi:flagellar protein FlgJ
MANYDVATAKVYTDFNQLQELKLETKHNDKGSLKQVAQQFESVFMGMVLKSMRQANEAFKSDLMNSDSMNFYQDMYDQQLAVSISGRGFGIAEMLEKQLSAQKTE